MFTRFLELGRGDSSVGYHFEFQDIVGSNIHPNNMLVNVLLGCLSLYPVYELVYPAG